MQTAIKYPEQKYTYADYLTWDDDQRWEIIDGHPYAMTAPSGKHQRISWEMSRQIGNYLLGKPCQGRSAPFDVRFPEGIKVNDKIIDVVQPDIVVVCDQSKLDDKGCQGAPDFIIEILSPSTASNDHILKLNLYEKNGVKEYWIVSPDYQIVMIYRLNETGRYGKPDILEVKGKIAVAAVTGLEIDFDLVFERTAAT